MTYIDPSPKVDTKQTIAYPDQKGTALVIDNKDRLKQGRVQLEFGSWAHPIPDVDDDGNAVLFDIPVVGQKVTWLAYSKSQKVSDKIWYEC
jgi:hypothetical protein